MLTIGCHLSTKKGFLHMAKEAVSINANTFQFFTRNPRGGAVKALDLADIRAYNDFAKLYKINSVLGYAPYTINPATADLTKRDFAKMVIMEDLMQLREVSGAMYLIRLWSSDGISVNQALNNVSGLFNDILSPHESIKIVLDSMAGEGHQVGSSFSELAQMLENIKFNSRVGVCLECSALWAAGYDIKNDLTSVLAELDQSIGLSKIYAIHLNDSKEQCGSKVNRHAKIGEGQLGLKTLSTIINHPSLKNVPFYLEEYNSILIDYERDIQKLRSVYIN
jgi:deoxyribonuclease-4